MKVHHDGALLRRVRGWMEHAWRCAGVAVLPGLLYRNVLLLLLREHRMVKGLILPQGAVQNGSVSLPPLPSHWRTSPEVHRRVAGLPEEPPLV